MLPDAAAGRRPGSSTPSGLQAGASGGVHSAAPRRYPRDGGALYERRRCIRVMPGSDFDSRLCEATSALEAAIANLTSGNAGAALDDVLAARLLLTTLRVTGRSTPSTRACSEYGIAASGQSETCAPCVI